MAIDLACSETGAGSPVVILHGLFGSKRNWTTVARGLGGRHRVLAADLRNHGESPWDPVHDYPAMAADVARLIHDRVGGPAAVIGHSMGGKVAMTLALERPELVERLVVVDIAPARSTATSIGVVHAMQAVPLASCARRADVEAALAEKIGDRMVRGFLVQNLTVAPDGLAWSVNLDALERQFDTILGFPDVPSERAFRGPTLFVAGGHSPYVQPRHRPEIERLFPAATIEVLADAGHWVHADAPAAFLDVVSRFLEA